ncbi:hypothetical protein PR202_ga02355 [Eleusine coracana subsp. coracana]|uniref:BHLH domain-containing protein n=1 Tax=Eleusine coracana subsp. coracana TaxID=191504 RepID=A0AAV5BJ90_ELECO|nr:hypothetical protein PR202_ga02355 [Eleusine coracana subsp. coracana]
MSALVDAPSSDAAPFIYDTFNAASFLFDNAAAFCDGAGIVFAGAPPPPPPVQHAADAPAGAETRDVDAASSAPRRKRRRRVRSCKSREEAESQRMTHIAVERNRRRQMNEYLAVLRALMPEAYVQRGDQASIVGGAIEFVKELEQQLQSLEAQKQTLVHQPNPTPDAMPMPMQATSGSAATTPTCCVESTTTSNCSSSVTEDHHQQQQQQAPDAPPPFARFFAYPQYAWRHGGSVTTAAAAGEESGGARPGVADVEVSLVESHASVRVMAPRRPGQLLKMVTGMQALRLTVLHLTVTTLDSIALYSLSVKVRALLYF